jgi:hypothetical protein
MMDGKLYGTAIGAVKDCLDTTEWSGSTPSLTRHDVTTRSGRADAMLSLLPLQTKSPRLTSCTPN